MSKIVPCGHWQSERCGVWNLEDYSLCSDSFSSVLSHSSHLFLYFSELEIRMFVYIYEILCYFTHLVTIKHHTDDTKESERH